MKEMYPFVLRPLPYEMDALEPHIDKETVFIHHEKHLATYVSNLNNAIEPYPELHQCSIKELILQLDTLPTGIQTAVKNNGGGVVNHNAYFDGLAPSGTTTLSGPLMAQINEDFGSVEAFREAFTKAALAVFGSGYAWLVKDEKGTLTIVPTANQVTLFEMNVIPVLCLDVWEHAYYLKNQNRRAEYIASWFSVINWDHAAAQFDKSTCME